MLQGLQGTRTVAVNLDRDLLRSNAHLETWAISFKAKPMALLRALGRAFQRRQSLGDALADELPVDASAFVYDAQEIQRLNEAQANGAKVVLESTLPAAWSGPIAHHLGLDTNIGVNLDMNPDMDTTPSSAPPPVQVTSGPARSLRGKLRAYAKAMRLEQWSKNILVFAPAVLAHRLVEAPVLIATISAFFCLGLVASSIYLLNDIMDLKQDRRHPTKRNRPFASGALPVSHGLVLIPLLLAGATLIASQLPPLFAATIGAYVVLNFAYTFYFKRRLMVDVLSLASSYTLRILAGNAATGIELSFWLLALSMFLFLSLALVKRYVELDTVTVDAINEKRVMGRGYRYGDIDMVSQLGVASAFSAVLVLALYVDRAGHNGLYKTPELIWLICPMMLYLIVRMWFLAKRRELVDDPVHFLIRDWRSHLVGALAIAVMLAAKWG
ncbi:MULTISPECIES: UbiA family prenyltransferase [unclassified Beijerinckia]|uniref:UbiA family prenyltransferase n=1 Tax=unclassified Beijerinckia TaxID=2638183 RepID=UPI00089C5ACB|nr:MULTISPECIES: UbiA family prenyltransferase [unclassified Beijerinckia]MDH7797263.1 4-hydroxybenzoate polyprenyltransferase [Beijerinckia sp. GAS462]SEC78536.1 4-hydroxybenzoate polyprenyltransferase [Beijerinckia sp. 28-YEA-48]